MKRELTKYFRQKLKLELSQEKTYVTDLRKGGIHFIGYIVKAERKRKTPDPATWTEHLVGKPLPDMERLSKRLPVCWNRYTVLSYIQSPTHRPPRYSM